MVILSSRISTKDDLTAFVHTMDELVETVGGTDAVSLILHPVGLPRFLENNPSLAALTRLREIITAPTVHLWNGGYAGAPGVHLTSEELAWDLTWARTNPWDSGFSRNLETVPSADFPVLVTAVQARQLGEEHMAEQGPLCLGYAGYTLTSPAAGNQRLWFLEGGRWKWLNSHVMCASKGFELQLESQEDPADCLHVILSGTAVSVPAASIPGAEKPAALRQADSPPQGTIFHSGVEHGGGWISPRQAAAVAAIRASRSVSRDRTAAILRGAAGIDSSADSGTAKTGGHDPFQNRELQGGVTGALRLDTDSVGVLFSAGRIAGLTYRKAPLTPAIRSQGFLQTTSTTRYLNTVSAAWFTGVRVRGVHEVAEVPGYVRLGVTSFAMDLLPGLALNISGQRSGGTEEPVLRQALLEIPLCDLEAISTTLSGALLDTAGQVREITILPYLTDALSERDSPLLWSAGAVGLRVDLPVASVWIVAAHPGAALPVAFTLGARAISGGVRISWYPVGLERTTIPTVSSCSRWSVSYRILAADENSASPVFPRVEQDLAGEIEGFTCQE